MSSLMNHHPLRVFRRSSAAVEPHIVRVDCLVAAPAGARITLNPTPPHQNAGGISAVRMVAALRTRHRAPPSRGGTPTCADRSCAPIGPGPTAGPSASLSKEGPASCAGLRRQTGAHGQMNIPHDYQVGYAKARKVTPEMASNYLAHTHIADPVAEAMTEDLAELGPQKSWGLIQAAMESEGEEVLRDAPASMREFFKEAETPPDWLDYSAFAPGVRMFHRSSGVILAAFVAGVLIEEFTTNIAKSFFITGRVRDQGVRRLGQNNRHI